MNVLTATSVAAIRKAALEGCAEAIRLTQRTGFEYGGLILVADEGRCVYSKPHTSRSPKSIDPLPIFREYIPDFPESGVQAKNIGKWQRRIRDAGIVSFYHVHPCIPPHRDSEAKAFSLNDVMAMRLVGFDRCYMTVSCTGKVYEATRETKPEFPSIEYVISMTPAFYGELIGSV